jgi:hypothetical protein
LQTLCTGVSLPLTIGLVMLLVWNLHLAIHNKTTIEFHEGVTAKIQVSTDVAPAFLISLFQATLQEQHSTNCLDM